MLYLSGEHSHVWGPLGSVPSTGAWQQCVSFPICVPCREARFLELRSAAPGGPCCPAFLTPSVCSCSYTHTHRLPRLRTHRCQWQLDSFNFLCLTQRRLICARGHLVFLFGLIVLFMTSCFSVKSHLSEQQVLFTYRGSSALPYVCSSGGS